MPENQGPSKPDKPINKGRPLPPAEYRWKPGQSGNPGGKPKGTSITAQLRRLLKLAGGPVGVLPVEDGVVVVALLLRPLFVKGNAGVQFLRRLLAKHRAGVPVYRCRERRLEEFEIVLQV